MKLVRLAIGAGFLLVCAAQVRLSTDLVSHQRDYRFRVPVWLTPFSDRFASGYGYTLRPQDRHGSVDWRLGIDDRLLQVNGKPFTGMASYLPFYWASVRRYDQPGAAEFTLTVQPGDGRIETLVHQRRGFTYLIPSLHAVLLILVLPPFLCILAAWLLVSRSPSSRLAWAAAGLLLSLSQLSLNPIFTTVFDLDGSPMGWEDWSRVPVVAGRAFLQYAWPAFLLAGAGTVRPLGWLGWSVVAGFLTMAGVQAGLAVAWSEDYRPWVGIYEALAAYETELVLLGMAGVALWVSTVDRWLGMVAGMLLVGAGVALYSGPEALESFLWTKYSDGTRKVYPIYPWYVVTPAFTGLVATATMVLAAIARAGGRAPLDLLGAWVLLIPLFSHFGRVCLGEWYAFVRFPVLEEGPELFLASTSGAVLLTDWWLRRRSLRRDA